MKADRTHPGGPRAGVLIFDGDCGFCTWAAAWARRRLPPGVRVVPYRTEDLSAFGLTEERAAAAVYWIDPAGRPHPAHLGVAETLRAMGGPWRLVGAAMGASPLRQMAAGAYRVVAANRHRLPGTTPACRRQDG